MRPILALLLAGAILGARAGLAANPSPDQPPTAPALAAPPRSIGDITAILDREKPDPAKVAALKQAADAEPPAGTAGGELAWFYFKRAVAANGLGRQEQERADYRKALEIMRPLNKPDQLVRMLGAAAEAELRAGDPGPAMKLRREEVSLWKQLGKGGPQLRAMAVLSMQTARIGRLPPARIWLSRAEGLLAKVQERAGHAAYWAWFVDRAHGEVLDWSGHFAEAEPFLRRAVAATPAVQDDLKTWTNGPPVAAFEAGGDFAIRDLGLNLLRQGRVVEAEVEMRRALLRALRRQGRYAPDTAILVTALGTVIAEEGRFTEAEKLFRAALDIDVQLGNTPESQLVTGARIQLAGVLVAQRRWPEALAEYEAVRTALIKQPAVLRRMTNRNIIVAIAALRGGKPNLALTMTEGAVAGRTRSLGENHYGTAEAHGFHAAALALTGDAAGALAEFRTAVPALLAAVRESDDEQGSETARIQRLDFVLESYLDLLADRAATDPAAAVEAFRIADAARGRRVQRALAEALARAAVPDKALADLVRREQDLRKEIAALYAGLAESLAAPAEGDAEGDQPDKDMPAEIEKLRAEHAALRQEIERRFPDFVNLIDPKPATIDQVQAALRPGEALIATYVGELRTYVWAVPKTGAPAFAAVELTRADLTQMVARLRKALDPNAQTLSDIPPFDTALASRLYDLLLKPVESGWSGATTLLVVPHGPLAQLPLSVLVTTPATLVPEKQGALPFAPYRDVAWLARRAAIMQLPSVASLATLRAFPPAPATRKPFIGFGDPWFNQDEAVEGKRDEAAGATPPAAALTTRGVLKRRNAPALSGGSETLAILPRLPETATEVVEAAKALAADPAADVYLGARASEKTVLTTPLADRRVVMFATHGLVAGDLDGLAEPALALSAPALAGGGGDGLLTMSKILGLRLDADWVVLSACNSAAGSGAGAEAVSGLGLAFFYAGTRAVLATSWPVETNSAQALTTALFRREAADRAIGRAEALRRAMMDLVDGPGLVDPVTRQTIFLYAHPIFWAPYSLIGEGGAPVAAK